MSVWLVFKESGCPFPHEKYVHCIFATLELATKYADKHNIPRHLIESCKVQEEEE